MGQCGSLVLERFSAAVANEAIEKIPLQFLSRSLAQQSVMCRGESRVSAHGGDSTLRHTGVHYALNHGSHYDVTVNQNGRNSLPRALV